MGQILSVYDIVIYHDLIMVGYYCFKFFFIISHRQKDFVHVSLSLCAIACCGYLQ